MEHESSASERAKGPSAGDVLRPITDRQRTEERLRSILDNSIEAIVLIDGAGSIQEFNTTAEKMFGYLAEDVLGENVRILMPEPYHSAHDGYLSRYQSTGEPHVIGIGREVTARRKDGSVFPIDLSVSEFFLEGRPYYTGIIRDLTERQRMEGRLRSILDNSIEAIVLIDDAGNIQEFNTTAERMLGYSADEVLGENVRLLMPEPYHSEHDGYLARYRDTRDPHIIGIGREVMARRKDGSVFPVDLSVSEFSLEGRSFYTGIIRDLTERSKLEEQLHQAQRVESIGQLAGGIAHDFNNLLTVITGYSAMLLAGMPDGDPNREGLEAIQVAGNRATELTAQLLAFGRRSVLEVSVVDINEVIRETEQMLRRTIGEDIQVVSVLAPSLPAVEVDSGRIGQVIMNLAINARDAMPRGGKLTVETEEFVASTAVTLRAADLPPGTYVRIAVTDNGVGMHPDVRDRVFEPFFTTKPVGKGTGLGLSVVHGIVKQSGGSIHVYSEPGHGTTFTIYLPAVGADRTASESPEVDDASQENRAETILIAEDEEGVRRIIQLILERAGYRVILTSDGESALEALRDEPSVALIISDVVMPGMSGWELGEKVALVRPGIPFLFISGYPDDAIVRNGILWAEVNFLRKPFTPDGLLGKVAAALRK